MFDPVPVVVTIKVLPSLHSQFRCFSTESKNLYILGFKKKEKEQVSLPGNPENPSISYPRPPRQKLYESVKLTALLTGLGAQVPSNPWKAFPKRTGTNKPKL